MRSLQNSWFLWGISIGKPSDYSNVYRQNGGEWSWGMGMLNLVVGKYIKKKFPPRNEIEEVLEKWNWLKILLSTV